MLGNSRQHNITLVAASNHQRQKYVKLMSLVVQNIGIIKIFTFEDTQSTAFVGKLLKILNKSPGIARQLSAFLISQNSAGVMLKAAADCP